MNAVLDGRSVTTGDKHLARIMALAMHGVFVALLVFGVSWQKKPPEPVTADLWATLPPMAQPKVAAPVEPEEEPEPPSPVPRVKPAPVPKAEPKAEPKPVPKADIALKQDKKAEPKAEPRPEPKKREEDKAALERKAAEAREREAQRKLAEAEAREAAEKAAIAKAAADKEAAARAAKMAAAQQEIDRYKIGIQSKVRSRMVRFEGNLVTVFSVRLFPGGELESATMIRSSGNAEFDAAVRQAISQSQPFAVPAGEMFQQFRQIELSFRP